MQHMQQRLWPRSKQAAKEYCPGRRERQERRRGTCSMEHGIAMYVFILVAAPIKGPPQSHIVLAPAPAVDGTGKVCNSTGKDETR